MGPKKGNTSPAEATTGSELTITCTVSIDAREPSTKEVAKGVHIRIASKWLDTCISTPNVLSIDNSWCTISYKVNDVEVDVKNVEAVNEIEKGGYIVKEWTQSMSFPAFRGENCNHKLECFNEDPGLYAFVLDRDVNYVEDESENSPRSVKIIETIVPIGFAYLDCSTFNIQNKTIVSRSQVSRGVSLSVELRRSEALFTEEESLEFEPFVINIDTLNDYPLKENEYQKDAIETCYIYGAVKINSYLSRKILASPCLVESIDRTNMLTIKNSIPLNENEDGKVVETEMTTSSRANGVGDRRHIRGSIPVQFRSCILPVIWDEGAFKESIANNTYQLKVFNENIFDRVITPKVVGSYNDTLPWNAEKLEGMGQSVVTNTDGKGKRNATDLAHESGIPNYFLPDGYPIHESDVFLIDTLWEALEVGSNVLHHGSARFRMEQMLSSAEDLFICFKRLRDRDEDTSYIIVRDNIMADVRLEKPSCPIRWKMPSKMSLRGALERCVPQNERIGFSTDKEANDKRREPRHEHFHQNTTRLSLTVEFRRAIKHPDAASSVLGSQTLHEIRDVNGAFLQTTTRTGLASTLSQTNTLRQTFNYLQENFGREGKNRCILKPTGQVQRRLQVTPFNRMIFVFKYDDDETLKTINDAVGRVNLMALADLQGSLRSYTFTSEEMSAAATGDLDVVCGFSLIDDNTRIIVIEGLAGPDKGMQQIYLSIPRLQPNSRLLKILCNPEVLFSERLYTSFGPDIKRIRIRDNISNLAQKPEIYDRNQVSESCFDAIDKIMSLKSATDLKSTRDMAMFPLINGLNELELLYGEAVSRIDLDGTLSDKVNVKETRSNMKLIQDVIKSNRDDSVVISTPISEALREKTSDKNHRINSEKNRRCPPTDSWNVDYEVYLHNRVKSRHNVIAENLEARKRAVEQASMRRRLRDEEDERVFEKIFGSNASYDGRPKIHCMSNNSVNFKSVVQNDLKENFRKVKDVTFTYSRDFVSQTICLGEDPTVSTKFEEGKRLWLTPSGFMANKPRTKEELLNHPKRPSEGRIEDLHIPFEEQGMDNVNKLLKSREENEKEKGFKTRFEAIKLFGLNNPIKFQRNIDVTKIGDMKRLPRGKSTEGGYGDLSREYWKSIFNGGEAAVVKMKHDEAEEKRRWHEKVVVDSLTVKVGGFKIRDKTIPVDRTKGILCDAPSREWIKKLRNKKSFTGKIDMSYQEAPFTAMNIGEWVPNASTNVMLRIPDKSKFMTTKDCKNCFDNSQFAKKTGNLGPNIAPGKDFIRFIDSNARVPKSQTIMAKKPVQLFSSSGTTGSHDFLGDPRWQRPQF